MAILGFLSSTTLHSETPKATEANFPKVEKPDHALATIKPSQCITCHTYEAGFSHPVDVAPSMAVPKHLPLNAGRVTCTTCHEDSDHRDHGKSTKSLGHSAAGNSQAAALLRPIIAAESFCTQCHDGSSSLKKTSHAAVTDRAHLQTAAASAAKSPRLAQPGLDDESRSCIACHDGTVASDAGMHKASMSMSSSAGQEHPVGVVYNSARPAGSEVRLINATRLDKRVRLFGQTVGCGSCHSVYARQEKLLVMSNRESGLCLSCHIQ